MSACAPEERRSVIGGCPLEQNRTREQRKYRDGRLAAGYLLGLLLAIAAPLAVLLELMWLLPVIVVPAVGVALIYRWFGRGPALFSAVLQIFVDAAMLGAMGMWMAVCASLLPLIPVLAASGRPFFEQLRISIASFALGALLAVVLLYLSFGGDAIARLLRLLPEALRALPTESLNATLATLPAGITSGMTVEDFFDSFGKAIEALIPVYQYNLPGLIFGGSLISALLCTPLLAMARGGDCAPLRTWALPASTTGGLLLSLAVSYILEACGVRGGDVAFQAVLDVTAIAFCVQALASMARRLHMAGRSRGMQRGLVAVIAVLAYCGASLYLAIYGCASAIFGSRGALKQRPHKDSNK